MSIRAFVTVAASGIAACSPSPGGGTASAVPGSTSAAPVSAAPESAPASAPVRDEFVLVRGDAFLRSSPGDLANVIRAQTVSALGDARAFRLIGPVEDGAWLEVETLGAGSDTLGPRRPHCYDDFDGLQSYRIRFFVRSEELSAVTTNRIGLRFGDGTAVTLSRGVAVGSPAGAAADSWTPRDLAVAGYELAVRLPSDRIGHAYRARSAGRPVGLPRVGPDPRLGTKAALPGEGRVTSLGVPEWGSINVGNRIRIGRNAFGNANVARVSSHPAGDLVALVTLCAELQVVVPTDSVRASATGLVSFPHFDEPEGPPIRAGAPVYWPDGRVAGRVVERHALDVEVEPAAGKRCFERRVLRFPLDVANRAPETMLRLCHDPADIGE